MGKSRARRFRRAPPAPSGPEQGDPEEEPAAELLEKVSADPGPAAVAAGGGPRAGAGCARGCGAGRGHRGGERGPPVQPPPCLPCSRGALPGPGTAGAASPPGLAPLLPGRAQGGALKPVLPPPASSEGFVRLGRAAGVCRLWEVSGKVLEMAGCRHSFASFLWFGRYT